MNIVLPASLFEAVVLITAIALPWNGSGFNVKKEKKKRML